MNHVHHTLPARSAALFIPALSAYFLGLLAVTCMPVAIGALIGGRNLSSSVAGLLGSVELLSGALTAIGVGTVIHRLPLRWLALAAAGIFVLASAASPLTASVTLLAATRAVAGIGAGACLAAGTALIALAADSVRFSGAMELAGGLLSAALLAVLPAIAAAYGLPGLYGVYAAIGAAVLLAVAFMPRRAEARASAPDTLPPAQSIRLIVCAMSLYLGMSALWAYTEQIGTVSVGLDPRALGLIYSASTVLGLLGAVIAVYFGERLGHRVPISLALLGFAACAWILARTTDATVFAVIQVLWGIAYCLSLPLLLGTAARMDPYGRTAAIFIGAGLLGTALGPAAGGFVVAVLSLSGLGAWVVALTLLSLIAVWPLLRR